MAFSVATEELDFLKEYSGRPETEVEFRFGQFVSNSRGPQQHGRQHFRPGVSRSVFKRLASYFMTAEEFTASENPADILKIYFASGVYCELEGKAALDSYTQLHQISPDAIFKRKDKDRDISNLEYAYRVAAARETNADDAESKQTRELLQQQQPLLTFRHLQRYSFANNGFRIDLSISRTTDRPAINLARSDLGTRFPAYEVEIELDVGSPADSEVLKRVYRSVQLVLCYIQDTFFPIARSMEEAAIQAYSDAFLPGKNKRTLFLGVDVISLSISNLLPPDTAPSTINICRQSPEDYTVTVKADGERCLLFVDPKGTVFMINRKLQARRTGLVAHSLAKTLIDGEFVQNLNLFLAFDMLFLRGEDIRQRVMFRNPDERGSVKGRIEELEDVCVQKTLWRKQSDRCLGIRTKAYFTMARRNMTDILSKSHDLWQSRAQLKYHADGLIFTPRAHPYPDAVKAGTRWDRILKWKPRQLLSIDFQVQVRKSMGQDLIKYEAQRQPSGKDLLIAYKVVDLYVGEFKKPEGYIRVPFDPDTAVYRKEPCYIARILVDDNGLMMATDPLSGAVEEMMDLDIVEFTYDSNALLGFEWTPIRVRGDKVSPNRKDTATNVWEALHFAKGLIANENLFELANDPINRKIIDSAWQQSSSKYYAVDETQDERSDSNIIAMRDFHNNVKRAMYMAASKGAMESAASDYISALLDLGAGRGGDYSKYRSARIMTVVAVDVDKPGLDRLLTKIHQPNEGSNKYPKYIKTVHADMTKLLSNGSAGLSEYENKKLNDDIYRRYGLEHFPIVSAQFSLHFAFESPKKMQAMLLNVFQNLQVGGYFIGCTLDGQTVFNRLKGKSQLTFSKGDQMYASITKAYKSKLKPTGMGIDVMVSSIGPNSNREYLVDFAMLQGVMESNLDLVIVDDDEAQQLGLPSGTGMFETLDGFLGGSRTQMTDAERQYSYLNRYFIFKKRGVGNAAVLKKWLSIM